MNIRYLTSYLLNLFFALVEGFLAIRFLLKIFGASASNGFVNWIYEMSDVLLSPFRGIFPVKVFESTYILEFSTLFAMLMYAVAGIALAYLLQVMVVPVKKNK